ncbi:hypothetical protein NDN08_006734 [Rhodosorus marinus]|uniref:Uncharacterized protein n=1 Tax=Rhodosorus marinus TaxID=101924 RepID=A0AAV8UM21_9RHOD|nr:hypothetical protein NDN08_006734 [Rhodosorus marinus]
MSTGFVSGVRVGSSRRSRGVSVCVVGDGGVGNGGIKGGDGDSGGGGGGGGGGDTASGLSTVLAIYGKKESALTPELRGLSAEQLRAYLEATKSGLSGYLAEIWPAWRAKLAADPKFGFKLLMEETVGLGLAVIGMVAARGKEVLNELDFAFCDIVVGAVLNFTALWMAAPSIANDVQSSLALKRWISSLPPNVFAASPPSAKHSLVSRCLGFLVTGMKFSCVGLVAGLAGTCISYVLLALRNAKSPEASAMRTKKLPGLIPNAFGWAGFMFVSSSPRYQLVAGLERGMFRWAPDAVAKTSSGLFRTMNNIVGGASWVWYARSVGLQ